MTSLPKTITSGVTETETGDIMSSLSRIFAANIGNERISIPILETLLLFFSSGLFDTDEHSEALGLLFESTKKELLKSKNIKKLTIGGKVLAEFALLCDDAENEDMKRIQRAAMDKLVLYLAHPYPMV